MSGFKTFIFFTLLGLSSLVVALEGFDLEAILLPMVCHVDPQTELEFLELARTAAEGAEVAAEAGTECASKVIKYAAMFMTAVSTVGVYLRMITSSSIFISLRPE